ncbi:Serine/threonine-protein kinase nak1 [Podospora conica]|nr:Serine/threonine-protein kinase nak1 [Schizothecium conicum]
MHNLQHLESELSGPKQKAFEDARKAQAAILRECAEAGREPPPYLLSELIGKGSFGRVYKATSTRTKGQLVAVKIISIEEGDTLSPGAADTFNDILKEVTTLKLLGSSGAKNVNVVLDSQLVGQSVWIITEYCAGGSVSSLMRPTGGLPEKWIIPILREVAEAVFWVHRQGIIHRDIKCANVLVTDVGAVQLCDFGVAGIIENKFDKRSTVTGTLQWMAPELFDSTVSYGMEVDIWAFGSMAYEVASGLPPNATTQIDISRFGSYLKQSCPRLEGDRYSEDLKNLVAFCLVDDPKKRPTIEQVQQHPYLFNTEDRYPTDSLSKLVSAYRLWEAQGGSRRSLFSAGGAQGAANGDDDDQDSDGGWVFDEDQSDELVLDNPDDAEMVRDAYGLRVSVPEEQPTVQARPGRRRRPPKNMPEFKGPLEKVFDPNTMTNYEDNSRVFYGRQPSPPPNSDLPLRDSSQHSTVRESLIDLDASLGGDTLSRFGNPETIKPLVGDMAKRKTQEWSFSTAMSALPLEPDEDYPLPDDDTLHPTRVFHPTQMPGPAPFTHAGPPAPSFQFDANRASALSLIDLDAGLSPNPNMNRESTLSLIDLDAGLSTLSLIDLDASLAPSAITRPSTAASYHNTSPGSVNDAGTPFDLEFELPSSNTYREPSMYVPATRYREPSMYVTVQGDDDDDDDQNDTEDDFAPSLGSRITTPSPDSDSSSPPQPDRLQIPSPASAVSVTAPSYLTRTSSLSSRSQFPGLGSFSARGTGSHGGPSAGLVPPLPPLPSPPSAAVLQGLGSREELKDELQSMIASLNEHLLHTAECLAALPVRQQQRGEVSDRRWAGDRLGEVM